MEWNISISWQLWGLHGNYGVYMYMAVMGSNVYTWKTIEQFEFFAVASST